MSVRLARRCELLAVRSQACAYGRGGGHGGGRDCCAPGIRRDNAPDDLQPRPRAPVSMNYSKDEPTSLVGYDEAVAGQNRASGRARSRWTVHLTLLITVIVALVPCPCSTSTPG